jgi:hypothetical protein
MGKRKIFFGIFLGAFICLGSACDRVHIEDETNEKEIEIVIDDDVNLKDEDSENEDSENIEFNDDVILFDTLYFSSDVKVLSLNTLLLPSENIYINEDLITISADTITLPNNARLISIDPIIVTVERFIDIKKPEIERGIREKLIETFRSQIGVRQTGNNTGPEIDMYLASVGYESGYAWCGAFVGWGYQKHKINIPNTAIWTPSWFIRSKIISHEDAKIGDVGGIHFSRFNRIAHIVVYDENWSDAGNLITTVEGNGQPLYSKILTPNGWITMKDIQKGDTILTPEGKYSTVTGVYPQGVQPVYEFTFTDGSTTRADKSHLWNLHKGTSNGKELILTTDELYNKLKKHPSVRYFLPKIQPQNFNKNDELPIDPYVLGLLLGDGGLSQTDKSAIRFTTIDDELLNALRCGLPEGVVVKHVVKNDYRIVGSEFLKEIKNLELGKTKSYNKFIPEIYLWSSIDARISILQGLMDTDGSIDSLGRMEFSTASHQLVKDVQFLIRSLGGKANIYKKTNIYYTSPNQLTPKKARDSYILRNIRFPDNSIIPFRLKRKADKMVFNRDLVGWRIKSIEYIGDEKTICISIDSDKQLYITDDFIPTHNTNDTGDRIGDGVYRKRRSKNQIRHSANWIDG